MNNHPDVKYWRSRCSRLEKENQQLHAEVNSERLKRMDLAQKLRITVINANQLRAELEKAEATLLGYMLF